MDSEDLKETERLAKLEELKAERERRFFSNLTHILLIYNHLKIFLKFSFRLTFFFRRLEILEEEKRDAEEAERRREARELRRYETNIYCLTNGTAIQNWRIRFSCLLF